MALLVLAAVSGAVDELQFNGDRMRAAVSAGLMATDLADYLVTQGATFREAHAAVGSLVRESEEKGIELDALPFSALERAHPLFSRDALDWLSPERSIARREIAGGTGPNAVKAQLAKARALLEG
jgi:argininosuccinate lyase